MWRRGPRVPRSPHLQWSTFNAVSWGEMRARRARASRPHPLLSWRGGGAVSTPGPHPLPKRTVAVMTRKRDGPVAAHSTRCVRTPSHARARFTFISRSAAAMSLHGHRVAGCLIASPSANFRRGAGVWKTVSPAHCSACRPAQHISENLAMAIRPTQPWAWRKLESTPNDRRHEDNAYRCTWATNAYACTETRPCQVKYKLRVRG